MINEKTDQNMLRVNTAEKVVDSLSCGKDQFNSVFITFAGRFCLEDLHYISLILELLCRSFCKLQILKK